SYSQKPSLAEKDSRRDPAQTRRAEPDDQGSRGLEWTAPTWLHNQLCFATAAGQPSASQLFRSHAIEVGPQDSRLLAFLPKKSRVHGFHGGFGFGQVDDHGNFDFAG